MKKKNTNAHLSFMEFLLDFLVAGTLTAIILLVVGAVVIIGYLVVVNLMPISTLSLLAAILFPIILFFVHSDRVEEEDLDHLSDDETFR